MRYIKKHEYLNSIAPLNLKFDYIHIQTEAFKNSNVQSLFFKGNTTIEENAFENCKNLTDIEFATPFLKLNNSFVGCNNIENLTISGDSILDVKLNSIVFDCCKIKNLTIKNAKISPYVFMNSKIENITLIDCKLEENCFYNINNVNSIWIENCCLRNGNSFKISNSNRLSIKLINCQTDFNKTLFHDTTIMDLVLDTDLVPERYKEEFTDKEISRKLSMQFTSCKIGHLFYNQNFFKEEYFNDSKFLNVEPINLDILLELKKNYKDMNNYYKKLEELREL